MGKYKYEVTLDFEIRDCANCPFRKESFVYENVDSMNKLSGVLSIQRRQSLCVMQEGKEIVNSEAVGGYNTNCPLDIKEV